MGGVNVSPEDFFRCFEEKTGDGCTSWGINIPRLKIYNNKYEVVHLGREICPARQAPGMLTKQGINVILIGKAADVIGAEGAHHFSQVSTQKVLKLVLWCLEKLNSGLIFANIQETDLAGHEQNTRKYAFFLEMVDKAIPQILEKLSGDDIFLITGDHGNDPTIGHPNHTREKTPLILFSRKIKSQDYGERKTLADIGASITKFFHAPPPESGRSFI
jgi:phosphopentomutase